LAHRSGLPAGTVQRVLSSASGKAVTALCWKAGFKMRFALEVQRRIARVPGRSILNARDGVDYPLSPEEMEIQLELFA
jgi:hypothetical protein